MRFPNVERSKIQSTLTDDMQLGQAFVNSHKEFHWLIHFFLLQSKSVQTVAVAYNENLIHSHQNLIIFNS